MPTNYELKPNKSAFIVYGYIKRAVYSFIFFIILYFMINNRVKISFLYFMIIYILLRLFHIYSINIQYSKIRYIFLSDKIIVKSGNVFSDNEIELVIKNITHVNLQLPYLENRLYNTGNIIVESAGTNLPEVFLLSIDNPEKICAYVETIMKSNGFKLSKSQLIQQEIPNSTAALFESIRIFFTTLFTILFIGLGTWAYTSDKLGKDIIVYMLSHLTVVFIVGSILLTLNIIHSILSFFDLKNRVYQLYSDTIVYNEGFLTKEYSFMPIENLSDTTLTQSMVDKMFKLYDVKVSCQGNAKEISFKNILNGPKLKSNIDSLINKAPSLVSKAGRAKPAQIKGIYGEGIYKQATYVQNIARDSSFTAELSMDRKRVTGGLLLFLPVCVVLFPLLIIWLIMLIYSRIKMNYTKYLIKPNSIEEQYSFMASSSREFSNDKIMSIIFRESFIDKFFNTCDIEFLSIGSSQSIKFLAIKKTDGLYENILAKIGIKQQGIIYEITSDFTVLEMLKSKFFTSLFGGIILLTAIILLYLFKPILLLVLLVVLLSKVITIVYNHIYYKRSKLTFFKDSINFREGIFYKVSYNVLYDNIKDITTLQYPFSSLGKITINIAGEHIEQKDDGKVKVSNDISIQYVSNIQTKNELLDLILYKRPSINEISQIEQNIQAYTPKLILTAKPDQANTLAFLLITSIFIIPIFFLPLSIPISIMDVRRTSYIIQPYRLVARSGILYKKQISILFKNIDHISFNQGMFNKSFNNGSIIVNTTGSSTAEMVIANIPNFKGFYDELKRHY